jgi:predicted MPP superfamily phosphohydrolase
MFKWRCTGRGRRYGWRKALLELSKQLVFLGGWPRALTRRLPGSTAVRLYERRLALLPRRGDGPRRPLRLALATDLHLGPCTHPQTLERAFALLRAQRPDVLLLGGDYVYHEADARLVDQLARLVASVPARAKYAVWGNHDLWTDHHSIERGLSRAGVQLLVNETVRLPAPWDDVALLGLDDSFAGEVDLRRALSAAERIAAPVTLALCHDTDHAPELAAAGVSLQLSGHTHGGQIALPGGRPLVTVGHYGRRFNSGWYEVGERPMHLFVSRGVGAVGLPLRLFAPADVALTELVSSPG